MIKKVNGCANNLEKLLTRNISKHVSCGCSMSTIWVFRNIKNKHSLYCGEDSIKTACISLLEHAENVINFDKKKTLPLTEKERAKNKMLL